jgi:fluoride ion exporter CrcB/FEX
MRNGNWLPAALNIFLSVLLCLLAVWFGALLVQWVNGATSSN